MKLFTAVLTVIPTLLLQSCSHYEQNATKHYNEKANEVILQVVQKSTCSCLLEIADASMIEISKTERPSYDVERDIMKMLRLKNKATLDSLNRLSRHFVPDYAAFAKHGITVVTPEELRAVRLKNDLSIIKKCPKGIICINKPIFEKAFKKAVLDYSFALVCTRGPMELIEYKNGSWEPADY